MVHTIQVCGLYSITYGTSIKSDYTPGAYSINFFYVIYSNFAVNYGFFEFMRQFMVKIWP